MSRHVIYRSLLALLVVALTFALSFAASPPAYAFANNPCTRACGSCYPLCSSLPKLAPACLACEKAFWACIQKCG